MTTWIEVDGKTGLRVSSSPEPPENKAIIVLDAGVFSGTFYVYYETITNLD